MEFEFMILHIAKSLRHQGNHDEVAFSSAAGKSRRLKPATSSRPLMKNGLKVAGTVCILALLGANLGLETTRVLAPSRVDNIAQAQQPIQTESRAPARDGPDYLSITT